jgi:hypothetical protein
MDEPTDSLCEEGLESQQTFSGEHLPIPQWQMDELDRRELEGDAPGIPWEEVKRQLPIKKSASP